MVIGGYIVRSHTHTCTHTLHASHHSTPDLSIDAMDVSGEHQLDVLHSVYKQRLTVDGQPITEEEPQPVEMGAEKEGNVTTPTDAPVVVKEEACGRYCLSRDHSGVTVMFHTQLLRC